jgi:predicted Zn-dependent peptidase
MKSLAFTPTSLENIKEDLLEAHRRRMATEPYVESYAVFDALLYPDYPYGHPLIGSGEDLKNLTLDDVKGFYERYYVPANAVLAIVGSFPVARAKELVSRYFDSIPPGAVAPTPPLPRFEQGQEVVQSLKDILLSCGHICQNLYLACESIGAGCCAVGAYDQAKMDAMLGLDGERMFSVYAAPVGKV